MFIGTLSLFDDVTHIKCGSKDAVTQFIAENSVNTGMKI